MGYAQAAITVHAPIEAVWSTLNDISRTPEWVIGLEATELKTAGAVGVGSIYIDYNRLGPFLQTTPWHITAFEPMSRQVHESESRVLPSTMILHLSPTADGTRVRMTVKYRFLPRLARVSESLERLLMNRLLSQALRQNLANLDAYLANTVSQAQAA